MDREDPAIPTISDLWPGANPLEREVYDLFGVDFEGHPHLRRIVLRDDFVGHPLRKDFELEPGGVSEEKALEATATHGDRRDFEAPAGEADPLLHSERIVLNMGPQHPSMHGVLHLWLALDGEVVVSSQPTHGYLHRCIEKLCEHRTYRACIPMMDRADYVSGFFTELALLLAVEELAEIEVTPKAEYLRVLMCELCRITSHHTWFAACGLDLGALTPFLYAFRYRERIIDVYEAVTGSRMMFNYFRPGGVKADLPPGIAEEIRQILTTFDREVDEYESLLTNNEIFRARSRGIGIIEPRTIVDYGVTGPMARASGVDVGPSARRALLGVRGLRHPRPARRGGRHLRPLLGARGRDARVGPDRLARARRDTRGPARERGRAARAQAPGGDGVSPSRKPARRARRAAGERRQPDTLAAQDPLPRLLEPARHPHRPERMPHR